jgi:hypothetical protein
MPMTHSNQYPQMLVRLGQYAQMVGAHQMSLKSTQYQQPPCHTPPTPTHVLQ